MEESNKKPIMIGVIMACVVLAVVITYMSSSGGNSGGYESIERGEMMWIKCNKPGCKAEYQIDKKDYYDYIQEHTTGMFTPPLVCKECEAESAYQAIKCEKCELIFFYGAKKGSNFADQCPKCNYSKEEADRKAAAEAMR